MTGFGIGLKQVTVTALKVAKARGHCRVKSSREVSGRQADRSSEVTRRSCDASGGGMRAPSPFNWPRSRTGQISPDVTCKARRTAAVARSRRSAAATASVGFPPCAKGTAVSTFIVSRAVDAPPAPTPVTRRTPFQKLRTWDVFHAGPLCRSRHLALPPLPSVDRPQ